MSFRGEIHGEVQVQGMRDISRRQATETRTIAVVRQAATRTGERARFGSGQLKWEKGGTLHPGNDLGWNGRACGDDHGQESDENESDTAEAMTSLERTVSAEGKLQARPRAADEGPIKARHTAIQHELEAAGALVVRGNLEQLEAGN